MRTRTAVVAALTAALVLTTAAPAPAAPGEPSRAAELIGRQALAANDGWAAAGTGTTGGSAATPERVRVVRTRAELVAALGGDNATNATDATSKIVYVAGTVDGFEGPDGTPLDCADLADPEYSLPAYLAAYDPATWGRTNPSGPLEAARVRSVAAQTRQTQINVGSNTTIIGLRGARLTGLTLMIDRVDNVIVRNIEFVDARDCFPAWSPTDGDTGNWNSQYDQISVRRSEHVWIDHNTFTDGDNPDSTQPVYFGRPWQVHDGSLDVTHTASLVTVSWNRFTGRDKVMLIGSSNTVGPDVGRLNVTVRHNLFDGTLQRLPRVRFGQVDVHENHYRLGGPGFEYALGVGVQSALYAENNFFTLTGDAGPADLLYDWGGTALTERGSWVRQGDRLPRPVSLLAAYNAVHDPDLGGDAGWTPTLRAARPMPAPLVPLVVDAFAGTGRLPL
ncbi:MULTISPECIES: polysaccharide lyase family 1 protein [Micromonospora]|uniref:pectate lyase family protein n=1 Tax=Micromonospora TaxID=1873 RepID=UPI0005BBBD43|nr:MULTISPECIES: pectate lyase [unclassified Micromonospora]MCK1806851.1 pectate lyase [Micromonospora sp. R42106]MCK1833657.1 pectate lyase [Micromonospora sp. R42003]MCK1846053.1 pectate lyase [Micromonospora sp. R42004]MCM1019768.1 pectate lyase [Micromonospora sp. XM-20-01]